MEQAAPVTNAHLRFWRRSAGIRRIRGPLIWAGESIGIVLLATLAYLAVAELAIRIALHVPVFAVHDFRHERAAGTINKAVQYDSELGWRLRSHINSPGFNTLDYGFRSNGDAEAKILPGGVLAVGSSFTAGSEVLDDQSWPAHLQQLMGWNVNNGGQGGYQADQIILLAEQLLPLLHPQAIVVDLIPGTIIGTGYASSGWPKPYFTIANGELAIHNSPVPQSQAAGSERRGIKWYLGHLAALDQFMATFFANFWFTADGNSFVTVHTDEVGVTCRLLARLKEKTDAADVRLLLYLQYGGLEVVDGSRLAAEGARGQNASGKFYAIKRWIKDKLKPFLLHTPAGAPSWFEASAGVADCARELGIKTVDELPTLRSVYEKNSDDLRKYYKIEADGAMGHKSPFGNMEVARLVAAAIGDLAPPPGQKSK
jgi:hypothetical protein